MFRLNNFRVPRIMENERIPTLGVDLGGRGLTGAVRGPAAGRRHWPRVDFYTDWCDPYPRDAGEKLPNLF